MPGKELLLPQPVISDIKRRNQQLMLVRGATVTRVSVFQYVLLSLTLLLVTESLLLQRPGQTHSQLKHSQHQPTLQAKRRKTDPRSSFQLLSQMDDKIEDVGFKTSRRKVLSGYIGNLVSRIFPGNRDVEPGTLILGGDA